MAEESENDNLENLKSRLYRKGEKFSERKDRVKIPKTESEKSSSYWKTAGEEPEPINYPVLRRRRGKLFWIGISALVLLVIGSAVYFFIFGNNTVSSRNIGIQINGPTFGESGRITNFNIFVENKNKVALESADLIFDFPANTFSQDSQPLGRIRSSMGPISAGASAKPWIRNLTG